MTKPMMASRLAEKISPAERKLTFDPDKIGFTLKVDDATIREIERMRYENAMAVLNRKPILFR